MTAHRASADLLARCKETLAAAGEAHAEIVVRERRRGCARFAVSELGQHMGLDEAEARVRVAHGARVAETTTSDLGREALVDAIHAASALARSTPETPGWVGFADGADVPPAVERWSNATAAITDDERASIADRAITRIRAAGLVAAGIVETSAWSVAVATTNGCARAHDGTSAELRVWALEDPLGRGSSGHGSHLTRDVSRLETERETEEAIRIAVDGKNAGGVEAGTYDVVMEPPAVAELLEWLSMIGLGAPEVETGTSFLAGRIGERVTGEHVTLVEDPCSNDDGVLAEPFDREGTARRSVVVVERGIARSALHDRLHASRAASHAHTSPRVPPAADPHASPRVPPAADPHAASTGSAVVPDFGSPGGVGAVALALQGGSAADTSELLAGIDRGLYVRRLNYVNGFLEPRRAVMTGLTRDGCFLVERGRIARGLRNLRMTDSFLEMLARSDGMTRARKAISAAWTSGGTFRVPAVRFRGVRFTSGSRSS